MEKMTKKDFAEFLRLEKILRTSLRNHCIRKQIPWHYTEKMILPDSVPSNECEKIRLRPNVLPGDFQHEYKVSINEIVDYSSKKEDK